MEGPSLSFHMEYCGLVDVLGGLGAKVVTEAEKDEDEESARYGLTRWR